MIEPSRRTLLGAAWAAPVLAVAVAAPLASASTGGGSEPWSLQWTGDEFRASGGSSDLVLIMLLDAPASTDDYVLLITPVPGYPSTGQLTADAEVLGWSLTLPAGSTTLGFTRPGTELPSQPTLFPITVDLSYDPTTGYEQLEGYRAVLTQGSTVLATSDVLSAGQPYIRLSDTQYESAGGATMTVPATFTTTPAHPIPDAAEVQVTFTSDDGLASSWSATVTSTGPGTFDITVTPPHQGSSTATVYVAATDFTFATASLYSDNPQPR